MNRILAKANKEKSIGRTENHYRVVVILKTHCIGNWDKKIQQHYPTSCVIIRNSRNT